MSLPRCRHLRHRQHRQSGLDQHRRICWLPDRRSGPAVPDHPRSRSDLHPPTAPHRVGHHALLHHPGDHLAHRHLRPAGDVTLAPRGHPIRPVDRFCRDGAVLYGRSHIPHRLLHQRGGRTAVQAPQQHGGGLVLCTLHPLHILHHSGTTFCWEGVFARVTRSPSFWITQCHRRLFFFFFF